MKTLREAEVSGKKLIVWTDLDVAVKNGEIQDDTRLSASAKTIHFLLEKNVKQILLLGHSGRPKGRDLTLSLDPIAKRLSQLIEAPIDLLPEIKDSQQTISMLENIRFWPQEEEKEKGFAERIASLGEIYINDCFSTSHHAGATMLFLPELLDSYAGLNLEREVGELSRVMKDPKRPLVAIIGGAKLDTKLPAISNLATVADTVLVGGKIMFEASKQSLPANVVVASDHRSEKDIGPQTIEAFKQKLSTAATVVWNGPMGLFEEEEYLTGTKRLAEAVVSTGAYSVVGGGETIAALEKSGLLGKMSFVSMGGGAMLDFLSGKKLPGLEVLGYY